MYHIYCDKNRITNNPISYNYLLKHFFSSKSLIDWSKISSLTASDSYKYEEYTIVRVV